MTLVCCCVRVSPVRPFWSESQPPGKNRGLLLRRSEEVFDFLDGRRTGFLRDLTGSSGDRRGRLVGDLGQAAALCCNATPCSSPPPTKLPHDIVWCLACSLNVLNLGGACSGVSTVACVGKILGEQNFKAAHTYSSALRRRLASSSCARSRAHHQLAASGGYVIFTDTKLCSITVPTFFMGEQVKQKP